ncbi:MAG TPA: SpoIID/LytB domain-containing protein [Myxococcota bacterium]|nr:SpoIID/LytB domain-containing protein [Myxococcota bacterium]
MGKNILFCSLPLVLVISSGCSHMVPAQVKKMPMIRVLHKESVENISLEKYVASVLAGEVHHSWPMETLKAQAIAARTFALLRMKERKNNDYHVQNSFIDQVLKTKPHEILVSAARDTAGLVLSINGRLAETSFHSTCGGVTADAKKVWGRSYPHLHGGACGYCKSSPTFKWETELDLSDIENKFSQKIDAIKIVSQSKDGRADVIELVGEDKKQKVSGHEFRMALGAMKVKSTLIKSLKLDGTKVKIHGGGFGHGVGMCQYGALGMGKDNKTFQEILRHYYPGTEIKRLY